MRKILIIAAREYRATIRTKAFVISILIMPLFMGGAIVAQNFLMGRVDLDDKHFVVLDHTGELLEDIVRLAEARNQSDIFENGKQNTSKYVIDEASFGEIDDSVRLNLSERVRQNEIFAFIEIGPDAINGEQPDEAKFYAENIALNQARRWFEKSLNQVLASKRLEMKGLDPQVVGWAITPVRVDSVGLYTQTAEGAIRKGDEVSQSVTIFLPIGIMMLMFASVMIGSQPMLSGVIEEKQLRIAEVLLGSANPFHLMMGKLLGIVGVSLTMVTVYLIGSYILLAHYGFADRISTTLLVWFYVYQVLAVLLFGSVFVAIGAACNDFKEAQSFVTPVMLLMILPMMVWINVLKDPLSTFSTWLSFFPSATPMLMVLRISAAPALPLWQPLAGIVVVTLTTVVCTFAAGRIFRIGLLSQGKTPKLSDLARWALRG